MIDWLRKLGIRREAPLTGAPPVRRLKTYSANTGYVYQYFYAGHRGGEYVFQASHDRRNYFPVSVVLAAETVESFERDRARGLNSTEQYAVAKLALFQAFDERRRPDDLREAVLIRRADLDLIADQLGFV